MSERLPETIVGLYDVIHAGKGGRAAKRALASRLMADPAAVADMFTRSVTALEAHQPRDEGFYGSRTHRPSGQRDEPVKSTIDLALRMRDAGRTVVQASGKVPLLDIEDLAAPGVSTVPPEELVYDYLDRELVATRTTAGGKHTGTAVRLDLLLCQADDRTPIVGEIKRTGDTDPLYPKRVPSTDKDAFSALVQALACVSQLATPAQYDRLARWGSVQHRDGLDVPAPADLASIAPPVFDVYIVLHNKPVGTGLSELGQQAERLSAMLLAQPAVARHVRRIACLITRVDQGKVIGQVEFAYQRVTPKTQEAETVFADYFRSWGLHIPSASALSGQPGLLLGAGWAVRWRWHEDQSLEFRAVHRMTNERWHVISPDGTLTHRPTPPEFRQVGQPPEEQARADAAHSDAWRRHEEAVAAHDMEFPSGLDGPTAPDAGDETTARSMAWKLDGGDWQWTALPVPAR